MSKKKNIFTYSLDNLPPHKTDVEAVRNMTEEEIMEGALSDPDAQPLTDEELAQFRRVSPDEVWKKNIQHDKNLDKDSDLEKTNSIL